MLESRVMYFSPNPLIPFFLPFSPGSAYLHRCLWQLWQHLAGPGPGETWTDRVQEDRSLSLQGQQPLETERWALQEGQTLQGTRLRKHKYIISVRYVYWRLFLIFSNESSIYYKDKWLAFAQIRNRDYCYICAVKYSILSINCEH